MPDAPGVLPVPSSPTRKYFLQPRVTMDCWMVVGFLNPVISSLEKGSWIRIDDHGRAYQDGEGRDDDARSKPRRRRTGGSRTLKPATPQEQRGLPSGMEQSSGSRNRMEGKVNQRKGKKTKAERKGKYKATE
ncbi:hypothetical protein NDU88_005253 [Pleurodeles waltl]|uniref:Uncharacterized protein n=1 Tax=Pleurodeles waltl TaxID=8319 RepID=A0AAV7MVQ8_PLEWA|nr:hypothetical protein NDU88_005253 [Pleurodeles waltl]